MWDCWRQSSTFCSGGLKILTLALDNFWEDPSCLHWWQTPAPPGWSYRGMACNPERRSPTEVPQMTCRGSSRSKVNSFMLGAWTLPLLSWCLQNAILFVSYWSHADLILRIFLFIFPKVKKINAMCFDPCGPCCSVLLELGHFCQ